MYDPQWTENLKGQRDSIVVCWLLIVSHIGAAGTALATLAWEGELAETVAGDKLGTALIAAYVLAVVVYAFWERRVILRRRGRNHERV